MAQSDRKPDQTPEQPVAAADPNAGTKFRRHTRGLSISETSELVDALSDLLVNHVCGPATKGSERSARRAFGSSE